jgi:putative FmdB family regulatory protein
MAKSVYGLKEVLLKMPIYEYRCEKCGEIVEKIQKISDPPLAECEKCNGKLNKILSHSSFVLKGSGWYLTDYSKKSSASSKSETKSESKSETKCEAKADTGGCGSPACGVKAE